MKAREFAAFGVLLTGAVGWTAYGLVSEAEEAGVVPPAPAAQVLSAAKQAVEWTRWMEDDSPDVCQQNIAVTRWLLVYHQRQGGGLNVYGDRYALHVEFPDDAKLFVGSWRTTPLELTIGNWWLQGESPVVDDHPWIRHDQERFLRILSIPRQGLPTLIPIGFQVLWENGASDAYLVQTN